MDDDEVMERKESEIVIDDEDTSRRVGDDFIGGGAVAQPEVEEENESVVKKIMFSNFYFSGVTSAEAFIQGKDAENLNSINLGNTMLDDIKTGMETSSFSRESASGLEIFDEHGPIAMQVHLNGNTSSGNEINGNLSIYEDGTMIYWPIESQSENGDLVKYYGGYIVEPSEELQSAVAEVGESLDAANFGYLSGEQENQLDVEQTDVDTIYVEAPWGDFDDEEAKNRYFAFFTGVEHDYHGLSDYQHLNDEDSFREHINDTEYYQNMIYGLENSDFDNVVVHEDDFDGESYNISFGTIGNLLNWTSGYSYSEGGSLSIYENGSLAWTDAKSGLMYKVDASDDLKDAIMDFYKDNMEEISESHPDFDFPNYYQIDAQSEAEAEAQAQNQEENGLEGLSGVEVNDLFQSTQEEVENPEQQQNYGPYVDGELVDDGFDHNMINNYGSMEDIGVKSVFESENNFGQREFNPEIDAKMKDLASREQSAEHDINLERDGQSYGDLNSEFESFKNGELIDKDDMQMFAEAGMYDDLPKEKPDMKNPAFAVGYDLKEAGEKHIPDESGFDKGEVAEEKLGVVKPSDEKQMEDKSVEIA